MCGVAHGAKSKPSSEHSNSLTGVPFSSSPVNVKVALVSVVSELGPESIEVSGALTSTTVQRTLGRRRVDVAGLVDGAHLEDVLAGGQDLDLLGHGAALERAAVQRALELELERVRLVVVAGELEVRAEAARAGARALGDRRRRAGGVGRQDDLPLVQGGRDRRQAERPDGLQLQVVIAVLEVRERDRRRARRERRAVERAGHDRGAEVGEELERRRPARAHGVRPGEHGDDGRDAGVRRGDGEGAELLDLRRRRVPGTGC